jgi:hypothetical protein
MNEAEFKKEIIGNAKFLARLAKELKDYSKLEDSEFKFKQLDTIPKAIWGAYVDLDRVLKSYKKDG